MRRVRLPPMPSRPADERRARHPRRSRPHGQLPPARAACPCRGGGRRDRRSVAGATRDRAGRDPHVRRARERAGQGVPQTSSAWPPRPARCVDLPNRRSQSGLSVLVEKPVATDEAVAAALVAEAERRGAVFAVGLVERCNPAVEALRAPPLRGASRPDLPGARTATLPVPGRESPVGVALDLATHDLDVIRFVTGSENRSGLRRDGRTNRSRAMRTSSRRRCGWSRGPPGSSR